MLSDILRWGAKRPASADTGDGESRGDEPAVPSKALPKFLAALSHQPGPPVLMDFGPVIGANVKFFGERLGCKLFIEDLFADYDRAARANTRATLATTIESRFKHEDASIDGILCWDFFDYLDKPAAQVLARQVIRLLRPGGAVMGFFGTTAVERAGFTKYELVDEHSMRHRPHAGSGGPKHVQMNRDIIKMFDGLIVSESFLLKTNTREILLRKKA